MELFREEYRGCTIFEDNGGWGATQGGLYLSVTTVPHFGPLWIKKSSERKGEFYGPSTIRDLIDRWADANNQV